MNVQKKCLQCVYATPDPNAPMDAILTGNRTNICLKAPPQVIAITQGQRIVFATAYPSVNKETISCNGFSHAASSDCDSAGAVDAPVLTIGA